MTVKELKMMLNDMPDDAILLTRLSQRNGT